MTHPNSALAKIEEYSKTIATLQDEVLQMCPIALTEEDLQAINEKIGEKHAVFTRCHELIQASAKRFSPMELDRVLQLSRSMLDQAQAVEAAHSTVIARVFDPETQVVIKAMATVWAAEDDLGE